MNSHNSITKQPIRSHPSNGQNCRFNQLIHIQQVVLSCSCYSSSVNHLLRAKDIRLVVRTCSRLEHSMRAYNVFYSNKYQALNGQLHSRLNFDIGGFHKEFFIQNRAAIVSTIVLHKNEQMIQNCTYSLPSKRLTIQRTISSLYQAVSLFKVDPHPNI